MSKDWEFLEDDKRERVQDVAHQLIYWLAQPTELANGTRRKRPGPHLGEKKSELAWLIYRCRFWYDEAAEDAECRNKPPKLPGGRKKALPYSYKEFEKYAEDDWPEFINHFYKRDVGHPTSLLDVVYKEIRRWWRKNVGPFDPRFWKEEEGALETDAKGNTKRGPARWSENYHWHNPAARMVLLIARDVDPNTSVRACATLVDRFSRKTPRARKRPNCPGISAS